MSFETSYLALLQHVLDNGSHRMDRTGVGTRAVFGAQIRHDLSQGFPMLTTKQIYWKTAFREMLWMLSGGNNIRDLLVDGVRIWSAWPHQRYQRETGSTLSLSDFEARIVEDESFAAEWGHLPNGYGEAWRGWRTADGERIDQVQQVIDQLRSDPYSRRIMWTGWNVGEIKNYTLPPCHYAYQFFVAEGKLSGSVVMRSTDAFLGKPFNQISLAAMVHMLAQQCDLEPFETVMTCNDLHVYDNHHDAVREQLSRQPRAMPTLKLLRRPDSLFDYRIEDFAIEGYDPHPAIKAPVAV